MIRNILIAVAVCAMVEKSSALMINRPSRSADTCGVPKSKLGLIIHGQDFPRGSYPWIVALMYAETGPATFYGGGTLISKTFVITAAHCILDKRAIKKLVPRNIRAIFGAHDLSDYLEAGRIVLSPKNILIHDDWNHLGVTFDADLALLEFDEGVIHFGNYIQPICLWDSENEPPVTEGIVTGWGKSEDPSKIHENKPKVIPAKIQSNEDCFFDEKKLYDLSSRRTFCAGLRNGSGVCAGDSGSGLFIEVDGVYHLKGIVSSSVVKESGCDVSINAVYTNVLKFKDWIAGKIGVVKDAFCTVEERSSMINLGFSRVKTCGIHQSIDDESYVLRMGVDTVLEQLYIGNNAELKFLPRLIGQKLPKLRFINVWSCGLTIVRDHYFTGMRNLIRMHLIDNKITTIESNAFRDLTSLDMLKLDNNLIKTLDESLFSTMVNLSWLFITDNKIETLSPKTFEIQGGKLDSVVLKGNVCINEFYLSADFGKLKANIKANCTQ